MVLFYSFVFGQKENVLVQKIRDNQTLMKSDMDKGYKELLPLEKQANKENIIIFLFMYSPPMKMIFSLLKNLNIIYF